MPLTIEFYFSVSTNTSSKKNIKRFKILGFNIAVYNEVEYGLDIGKH
jgi:hypothetical protein